MLAPFIAHDDVMQLTTDLHGLLPDYSITEWMLSDPLSLQTTLGVSEVFFNSLNFFIKQVFNDL